LVEAGVGLEEIIDRLVHQHNDVTRKIYFNVTTGMKAEATDKSSALKIKTRIKN